MPNETPEVAEFLREVTHPSKDGIMNLRAAILASDERITEHITVVGLVGRWMRATA